MGVDCQPPGPLARAPSILGRPLQNRDNVLASQTTWVGPEAQALWPQLFSHQNPRYRGGEAQPWLSSGVYQVISVGLVLLWGVQRMARLGPAPFSWAK